jgi:hypothetical protein
MGLRTNVLQCNFDVCVRVLRLRLSALAILQIHPLKGIFLPSHQEFFRTHHPLYLILHTNNLIFSLYFIDSFELPSSLSLHSLSSRCARALHPSGGRAAWREEVELRQAEQGLANRGTTACGRSCRCFRPATY